MFEKFRLPVNLGMWKLHSLCPSSSACVLDMEAKSFCRKEPKIESYHGFDSLDIVTLKCVRQERHCSQRSPGVSHETMPVLDPLSRVCKLGSTTAFHKTLILRHAPRIRLA